MKGGLLAFLLGALLIAISLPIVVNWRCAAERYSDFIDAAIPTLPRPRFFRRTTPEDRWRRMVRQNRIIFAVVGCFGLVFLIGGIVSLA